MAPRTRLSGTLEPSRSEADLYLDGSRTFPVTGGGGAQGKQGPVGPLGPQGPMGFGLFDTRAEAQAATIPIGVDTLTLNGYSTTGDSPAANYKSVADTGTLEAWQFRSNGNTRRWQLVLGDFITPEMVGGDVQAAVNAAYALNGGGEVRLRTTYSLSAALQMKSKVRLTTDNGAGQLVRAGIVVEFVTFAAHGASVERVTVDGGHTPSTVFNSDYVAIFIGSADDVTIDRCTIQNSTSNAVGIQTGMRSRITRNRFYNICGYAVSIARATKAASYALVEYNTGELLGFHAVGIDLSDKNIIRHNNFTGARTVGLVVSFNGTTVTRVSGPTFTNAQVFTCLISNYVSGTTLISESQIMSVAPDGQSCTINAPLPAGGVHNNRPASYGAGDLYTVFCGSDNDFIDNIGTECVGAGVSVADNQTLLTANNRFIGNLFKNIGQCGILIAGDSVAKVYGTKILDNTIINVGLNGSAGDPTANVGIYAFGGAARTFVGGNTLQDDQGVIDAGAFTMLYGLAVGATSDIILVGSNEAQNPINPGIRGGVASVTLSAGWGSTASVSNIVHHGNAITFTITSSGTGQAVNPTMDINHLAGRANPQPTGQVQIPANGTMTPLYRGAFSKTNSIFYYFNAAAPVNGGVYNVTISF